MRQAVTRALAQGKTNGFGGLLFRQSIPIFVVAALLWAMRDQLNTLDYGEIRQKLADIHTYQWCLALGATSASFWAIGRYDEIVHAVLRSPVGVETARTGGITAVAISQFAGFGALTATLVRWRMLPQVSLLHALRISAVVTASFLVGWAFVTSFAALMVGNTAYIPGPVAGVIVLAGLVGLALPSLSPRWPPSFPSTAAMLKIIFLVAIDVGFAALALYALLPGDIALSLAPFMVAFSIALLAGLMSGTPGGIGAFELCLVAQLPHLSPDTLVAAALGFRLVYHVIPALLAMTMLVLGPREDDAHRANAISYPRVPHLPPRLEAALWHAPFAEAKLVRQGDFAIMGPNTALIAEAGQSLTLFSQPILADKIVGDWLHEFKQLAHLQSRAAGVYKAPPRLAAQARRAGWRALPIAQEALITTKSYQIKSPKHRQLRRMLRKAEQAGVQIEEAGRDLPLNVLADISRDWACRHGGERGFSMGRFDDDYVQYQRVFLARAEGKVLAFITLHEARAQWTLDIMRHHANAPAGTMHALLHAALLAAQEQRVPEVSLAACPFEGAYSHLVPRMIADACRSRGGNTGLQRFKSAFAPRWQTRYALAPSWREMAMVMWDVSLKIHGIGALKLLRKSRRT